MKVEDFDSSGMPIIDTTDIPAPSGSMTPVAGYNLWSATVSQPERPWNIAVDSGSTTYESRYVAEGSSYFKYGSGIEIVCPN